MTDILEAVDRLERFALAFDEDLAKITAGLEALRKESESRSTAIRSEILESLSSATKARLLDHAFAMRCELSKAFAGTERELAAQIRDEASKAVELAGKAASDEVKKHTAAVHASNLAKVQEIAQKSALSAIKEYARIQEEDMPKRVRGYVDATLKELMKAGAITITPAVRGG